MIELLELSQVLKAVERTGTEVRYYDKSCEDKRQQGFYRLNSSVDLLVICTRNHVNHSDLLDTVRHEAIHVVQACNAGEPVLDRDYYAKNTDPDIKDHVETNYPEAHHHHELEAFMAAEYLGENDVVKLIDKYCF